MAAGTGTKIPGNLDVNATGTTLQAFCKDVQHGHAKVIRCLEDNLEQPTFNATCKAEIQKHAANSATDYRWAAGAHCPLLCPACLPALQAICILRGVPVSLLALSLRFC